eukprot:TRINITY_DN38777_c0_g1_i1.p1 TRINITY_DN38777_c0_g1~~TRINITY_DN38777_c0_g1_i1.p1  ORF type:complete len:655 (+),score=80.87 TRINITY_DN38777_c0_g1_i1:57-2021(+)
MKTFVGASFLIVLSSLVSDAEIVPATETWNGCDMAVPEFYGMWYTSQFYYNSSQFALVDVERVKRILENREVMKETCPAVVLQALLLKLEENLPYEPGAYQHLTSTYTEYLHDAIKRGKIGPVDFEMWPLNEGLRRISALYRALNTPRRLTSAMVMNYCQVVDRFGATHELDWILEPPFGDLAQHPSESGDVGLLNDTELYIYIVDWPWCKAPAEDVLRKVRKVVRNLHLIKYRGGPRREEQSAYFKYIVDHWDSLPDFTIFVHPDADEHQGTSFLALRRALKVIRTQSQFAYDSIGYYPLASQMVVDPRRTWGNGYASSWRQFWKRVFGRPWSELGYSPPRCKWTRHIGFYLEEYADGRGKRHNLSAAKSACDEYGDKCKGVTCNSPLDDAELFALETGTLYNNQDRFGSNSCSVRRGATGLIQSPQYEVSYMKSCAPPGRSAHADAEFHDARKRDIAATTYLRQEGTFIPDYAAGDDAVQGETDAMMRCEELGDRCTGYTCTQSAELTSTTTKDDYAKARDRQSCTVRGGSQVYESPSGEVSFVKVNASRQLAAAAAHPTVHPDASAVFQFYTGSQSVVREDRLRRWPLKEYQTFAADGVFCQRFTGLFEAVWHRMFGEPLSQHTRESDPSLPLYLKWETLTMYSNGDEGVI